MAVTSLESELLRFFDDWFVAIKRHDRAWVDSHLSPEFSDWIVPSGKALLRADFLDVEMSMVDFDAEILEIKAAEAGGYINSIYTLMLREKFPAPEEMNDDQRKVMEESGVFGHVDGVWIESRETVVATIFRRADDGRLLVVHHMLAGLVDPAHSARSR